VVDLFFVAAIHGFMIPVVRLAIGTGLDLLLQETLKRIKECVSYSSHFINITHSLSLSHFSVFISITFTSFFHIIQVQVTDGSDRSYC
jgi:hypothetical protein